MGNNLIPQKNSILDLRRVYRKFREINYLNAEQLYPFQPAIEYAGNAYGYINGKKYALFSSYDYLGLIGHPGINDAAKEAIDKYGTGTGGVRLLSGTNNLHHILESKISTFKGTEASMTFTSGYMANLAIAMALIGTEGMVFADEHIHRSFIDALKLAGSKYKLFRHNDPDSLQALLEENKIVKRKFIVTEGIFSMDGDICPLPEIVKLKKQYHSFLIIDEAHSFGVLGPNGKGVDEHFNISPDEVDIFTGSLSKAIPANGGFIAASDEIIVYLQHECSPFVFSGALCPPATAAAIKAIEVIESEKWRLSKLHENGAMIKAAVISLGYHIHNCETPVIPLATGGYDITFLLTKYLKEKGLLVLPVVFPAVPLNRSIVRLCATASHDRAMIDKLQTSIADFREEYCKVEASILP